MSPVSNNRGVTLALKYETKVWHEKARDSIGNESFAIFQLPEELRYEPNMTISSHLRQLKSNKRVKKVGKIKGPTKSYVALWRFIN